MADLNGVYDPTGLSEDELITRIQKLRNYIGYQYDQNYVTSAESMELILAILEEEYEYRIMKNRAEAEEKNKLRMTKIKNKHPNDPTPVIKPKSDVITIGRIAGVDD